MDTIKVLIVEDNNVARFTETQTIKQLHCNVDAASTGAEALNLLSHEHYDLVFMDIGLPDTDGLKLAKEIRSSKCDNHTVPIVALTSHDDNEYKNQAIWVGMDSYIIKPLTLEKCKKALKKFVTV